MALTPAAATPAGTATDPTRTRPSTRRRALRTADIAAHATIATHATQAARDSRGANLRIVEIPRTAVSPRRNGTWSEMDTSARARETPTRRRVHPWVPIL